MTVSQLHVLLDDARGHADTPRDVIVRLARADSLYGVPNYAAAVPAYDAVVAAAPARWSGYSRVVEALQLCLTSTDQNERSITLARAALPRLGVSGPAMNVAAAGLESAVALPETSRVRMPALAEMEAATHRLVTDFTFTVAADDRSGAWIALLDARHDANDSLGVRRVAACWSTFLDGEAAAAQTPEERTVFDSHRLSAYMELDQPERAIPMLEQSQKDFPGDYNPPYRLAIAYRALHRWDAALVAAARADSMMYGPRKLNLYDVRTDVYLGRGDPAAAKRSLEDAIKYAEGLPEEQRSAGRIAGYRKRLAAMR